MVEVNAVGGTSPKGHNTYTIVKEFPFQERCLNILKKLGLILAAIVLFPILLYHRDNHRHPLTRLYSKTFGEAREIYQPFKDSQDTVTVDIDNTKVTVGKKVYTDLPRDSIEINGTLSPDGDSEQALRALKRDFDDQEILNLTHVLYQNMQNGLVNNYLLPVESKKGRLIAPLRTQDVKFPSIQIFSDKTHVVAMGHQVVKSFTTPNDKSEEFDVQGHRAATVVVVLNRKKLKKEGANAHIRTQFVDHGFRENKHSSPNPFTPTEDDIAIMNDYMKAATEARYLADLGLGQVLPPSR